jgi:hypothetical protein
MVVNPNFGKKNPCVSYWFTSHYLDIFILAFFCHFGGATWLRVFVKCRHSISIKELILKPYTKFEFKSNKQTRRRRREESLPGKPGGTGFGQCAHSAAKAPVQRFRRFFQRFRTFQKLQRKVRSIRDLLINLF